MRGALYQNSPSFNVKPGKKNIFLRADSFSTDVLLLIYFAIGRAKTPFYILQDAWFQEFESRYE
jgi:hypothetical protein